MIHALFFFSSSWVDVDSIMSNKTMEYDPIREIFSIDPIDAIVLDEFVKKIIVVRIILLLIKLEQLPLVDDIVEHLIICIQ